MHPFHTYVPCELVPLRCVPSELVPHAYVPHELVPPRCVPCKLVPRAYLSFGGVPCLPLSYVPRTTTECTLPRNRNFYRLLTRAYLPQDPVHTILCVSSSYVVKKKEKEKDIGIKEEGQGRLPP